LAKPTAPAPKRRTSMKHDDQQSEMKGSTTNFRQREERRRSSSRRALLVGGGSSSSCRPVLLLLLGCCGIGTAAAFPIPREVKWLRNWQGPFGRKMGIRTVKGNSFKEADPSVRVVAQQQQQQQQQQHQQPSSSSALHVNNEESSTENQKSTLFLARNPHWILLVDDEEAIRQSVGDFLFDAGYQITACADAESAMDILVQSCTTITTTSSQPSRTNTMDLVRTTLPGCAVLDIRMPGGPDGIELLKFIRSSKNKNDAIELQRLPIILLTAKGMTDDRIRGYAAGCDFYLPKPFVPDELLAMVDAAVLRKYSTPSPALEDVYKQVSSIKAQLLQSSSQVRTTTTIPETTLGSSINNDDAEDDTSRYVYLTPSERNVLELLCDGLTNQEIAKVRDTSKVMVCVLPLNLCVWVFVVCFPAVILNSLAYSMHRLLLFLRALLHRCNDTWQMCTVKPVRRLAHSWSSGRCRMATCRPPNHQRRYHHHHHHCCSRRPRRRQKPKHEQHHQNSVVVTTTTTQTMLADT
jgi:DNA-binding response OmpR family regulator